MKSFVQVCPCKKRVLSKWNGSIRVLALIFTPLLCVRARVRMRVVVAAVCVCVCVVPCRAVPCRAVLCRVVPCRAVPYRHMSCRIMCQMCVPMCVHACAQERSRQLKLKLPAAPAGAGAAAGSLDLGPKEHRRLRNQLRQEAEEYGLEAYVCARCVCKVFVQGVCETSRCKVWVQGVCARCACKVRERENFCTHIWNTCPTLDACIALHRIALHSRARSCRVVSSLSDILRLAGSVTKTLTVCSADPR
jgi:hypothetical protein